MNTLFCIIGTFFYVVLQPEVLAFLIAVFIVYRAHKKGAFQSCCPFLWISNQESSCNTESNQGDDSATSVQLTESEK